MQMSVFVATQYMPFYVKYVSASVIHSCWNNSHNGMYLCFFHRPDGMTMLASVSCCADLMYHALLMNVVQCFHKLA